MLTSLTKGGGGGKPIADNHWQRGRGGGPDPPKYGWHNLWTVPNHNKDDHNIDDQVEDNHDIDNQNKDNHDKDHHNKYNHNNDNNNKYNHNKDNHNWPLKCSTARDVK